MCLEVLRQLSKTSWMIKQDFVRLNIFFKIGINSYSVIKCLHGMREASVRIPIGPCLPLLPCDIWWLSVGLCSDYKQQRNSLVSLVPARFRADSGMYLFKQGEIVTGWSSGSSARMVWFESRSGHVFFFTPLWHLFHDQFRCGSHRNKHHHPGFGASIQEIITQE